MLVQSTPAKTATGREALTVEPVKSERSPSEITCSTSPRPSVTLSGCPIATARTGSPRTLASTLAVGTKRTLVGSLTVPVTVANENPANVPCERIRYSWPSAGVGKSSEASLVYERIWQPDVVSVSNSRGLN
jgi:hypothetical protein